MAAIPMTNRIAINLLPSLVKDNVLGKTNRLVFPFPVCFFLDRIFAIAVSQGRGADKVRWIFI
ncbi:MAG: hypothetical protein A3H47_07655 [Deltaproteobacteria bacterium RIFCSPLOWO2_02_FULL_42_39]|nr:MAG: hypothetical protein A3D29_09170 [Deltaproteobacteria bacterium RIFCSPHIGHO2_02_FULL_42_44]OGQ38519.1 MAG: hypothetical protein A3H47_07655 [Deltaproteobacteria bacterium RIFCSPLOWO2_02_FULL_42_39]